MPLDAICLSALTSELSDKLTGGRIDKVQQPERDMLLISLRSKGENLRLLISAGTGSARVHLTKASFENPAEPPMFCMLMRKHLVGARIASVSQPEGERMLCIELDSRDELGFETRKKLIAELIGRSSNLIRLLIVVFKHALFDFNDAQFVHRRNPSFDQIIAAICLLIRSY